MVPGDGTVCLDVANPLVITAIVFVACFGFGSILDCFFGTEGKLRILTLFYHPNGSLTKIEETLRNFTIFWKNFAFAKQENSNTTKLYNFVNFMFCNKHNFDCRKKMIYRFICKRWPPCVQTILFILWNVSR